MWKGMCYFNWLKLKLQQIYSWTIFKKWQLEILDCFKILKNFKNRNPNLEIIDKKCDSEYVYNVKQNDPDKLVKHISWNIQIKLYKIITIINLTHILTIIKYANYF